MSSLKVNIPVIAAKVRGTSADTIAILGSSDTGTSGDFVAVGDTAALAAFGVGSLVTIAEPVINAGGKLALWRDAAAVLSYGAAPTLVSGGGTILAGDITYDAIVKPKDRSFMTIVFTVGGTVGVAGIKYKMLRSYNPTAEEIAAATELTLGTATFIASPDGIKINLAATKTVTATTTITNCEGKLPSVADATITAMLARLETYPGDTFEVVINAPLSNAQLALVKVGLDALASKGKRPTVYCVVGSPSVGDSAATFLTAVQTAVSGITDDRITPFASEAFFASAISGRSRCMYPVLISVAAKLPVTLPQTDLRSTELPPSAPGDSPIPSGLVSGPTLQKVSSATVQAPLGDWDDSRNDALSALKVGSLRNLPGNVQSSYISDAPALSATGSAIEQVSHARVTSRAYSALFRVMFTLVGQIYPTYPAIPVTPESGRILPYVVDRLNHAVENYVANAIAGMANALSFSWDATNAISDGSGGGTLYLGLFNTLVTATVPIVVSR
jgi:hypothetical protein